MGDTDRLVVALWLTLAEVQQQGLAQGDPLPTWRLNADGLDEQLFTILKRDGRLAALLQDISLHPRPQPRLTFFQVWAMATLSAVVLAFIVALFVKQGWW